MATYPSLSEDELARAIRMAAAALEFISAEAAIRDGMLDEEVKAGLLERRKQSADQIDAVFALELTDRLGEEALRKALAENTPPSARPSIDALVDLEGGALPFLKNRIGRIGSGADVTIESNAFGCASEPLQLWPAS